MEINKIYEGVSINDLHIKRDGSSFRVSFEFTAEGKGVSAVLSGVRDAENLCELLNASKVWIDKSEGIQVEFGAYTLGISHEYYTEISFDAISQSNS